MRLIAIYFPERGAYTPKDIEELRELEQERPFGRLHRRLSRRPRPASPPPTPTAEDLLAAASAACAAASAAAEAVRAAVEGLQAPKPAATGAPKIPPLRADAKMGH
ncbi:predicted protein [Aspergillus terreus NIH2624]|uniref:Uncharacterized protein n=1 Tax=Aspergillus terreus (strain NIH 2624 / FGSC A1156) TaxID=341663 RepID=Q0CV37_ASPTN|nr:uncharacterized protein ATEG_02447 [Aspergillus terreus NIH2624]EAU37409.1 predicted protein [Aspergillus terreus NIH2624]